MVRNTTTANGFQCLVKRSLSVQLDGLELAPLTGRGGLALRSGDLLLGDGLVHGPAQPQDDQGGDGTDRERDAPAPRLEVGLAERGLEDHEREEREDLPAHERHVLEAREEAAALRGGDLGHVGGARAVLAAHGEALQQARRVHEDGGPHADLGGAGQHRDEQRADAHEAHTERQGGAAAVTVRVAAEEPRADRTHEEGEREREVRIDLRLGGILGVEEVAREVRRERRVDVEVVPFDEVPCGALEGVGDGSPGLSSAARRPGVCDAHGHRR
jgi:hypothetical protein